MNTQNTSFHYQRLIFAIAAGIGAIAAFLPWVSVSFWGMTQSVSGFEAEHAGKITLLAFVGILVLCFLGDRSRQLDKNFLIGVTVLGGIALAVPIYGAITLNNNISQFTGGAGEAGGEYLSNIAEGLSDMIKLGIGYWLTLLAGIAIAGLGGYTLYKEKNGQAVDINIDTEKIGKAFATGASVVKAAGTAATQAVKETIENQKNDSQTEAVKAEPVLSELTQENTVATPTESQAPVSDQTPEVPLDNQPPVDNQTPDA